MTRLWRVTRWVLAIALVLLLSVVAYGVWTVRRSFPQLDGDATLAALDAPVVVHRDEWGVPRIVGDSVEDLVRAQGYVDAQDRFWEMDVRRHITAGRLSELFGPEQLDTDRYIRTLGWRRVAEQEYDLVDDRSRAILDAYAEGVNAYVADRSPAALSLEYAVLGLSGTDVEIEPWKPVDSLAWLKAMAWDLRSNSEDEVERALLSARLSPEQIAQLWPPYPYDEFDPIVTGTAGATGDLGDASGGGLGSNSWVVSGRFTASGGALLANDPHLAPSQPGIWHQVGLHCRARTDDCPLDVSGFALTGVPGVVVGRNHRIAWGVTNLAGDVADQYVEVLDDRGRHLLDGEWVPLDVRTETIEVAGGEPVEVTIRSTHRGPLLSDVDGTLRELLADGSVPLLGDVPAEQHAISLRWTALTPGRTFDAFLGIATAEDFAEFRDAARSFDVPAQNLVYADVDGHIGYQAPGVHPVRADGHDGRTIVPGWTSDLDWRGTVPFDDLPTLFDPDEGYIATANEPVVGPGWPRDWPGSWAPGHRAARIDLLLREALADGAADVEEMAAIQLDERMLLADVLLEPLLAVDVSGHAAVAQAQLVGWDGQMEVDSAAAAVFAATYRQLLLRLVGDELPPDVPLTERGRWWLLVEDLLERPDDRWWDDLGTAVVEDRDALLRIALVEADAELTALLGEDVEQWRWGAVHTLTAEHGTLGQSGIGLVEALFNRGPYEVGGGGSVVNATGWSPDDGYEVTWVPSMRMVVDTGAPDDARWINLTGQSGHAYHPNYDDLAPLWARGETIAWPGTSAAVEAAATSTLVLTP